MPFNSSISGGSKVVPFFGGSSADNPANVIIDTSAPPAAVATRPVDPPVGTIWINVSTGNSYQLVQNTYATGGVWTLLGGAAGAIATLTGDSGGAIVPVAGNITLVGGTGIATVGTAGTLTFNVVGGGLETTVSTSTPASPAVNTRLVTNTAGLFTVNLPAVAAVGDMLIVTGLGAGGWILDAAAGDTINSSGGSTSSGGTLASTNRYDSISVVCVVASTTWVVEAQMGVLNIT